MEPNLQDGRQLKDQTLLVTGATGFIGSQLCRRLIASGARVIALTRRPRVARARLGKAVTIITDLLELPDEPLYGVINLAGEPIMAGRWTHARREAIYHSRVNFTSTLLEYLKGRSCLPHVLISGSAIGYYGDTGDRPTDEECDSGEGFAATLCRDWEAEARRLAIHDTRVCTLRTGIVLGPDGGALKAMLPAFKLGLGGPIASGRQWMSWIHRDDLVSLIIWALADDSVSGPVNGTAPNPVTNRVFARTLGKALSRPAVLPAPAFAIRLALGQAGEELLLASNRVVPKKALSHAFQFRYEELEDALKNVV